MELYPDNSIDQTIPGTEQFQVLQLGPYLYAVPLIFTAASRVVPLVQISGPSGYLSGDLNLYPQLSAGASIFAPSVGGTIISRQDPDRRLTSLPVSGGADGFSVLQTDAFTPCPPAPPQASAQPQRARINAPKRSRGSTGKSRGSSSPAGSVRRSSRSGRTPDGGSYLADLEVQIASATGTEKARLQHQKRLFKNRVSA